MDDSSSPLQQEGVRNLTSPLCGILLSFLPSTISLSTLLLSARASFVGLPPPSPSPPILSLFDRTRVRLVACTELGTEVGRSRERYFGRGLSKAQHLCDQARDVGAVGNLAK